MSNSEFPIDIFGIFDPGLCSAIKQALGEDYNLLRTFQISFVTRELMSVVPEFVHVTEPELQCKNERMLLLDAEHNLITEVPRKVTKWHGDNNRGIVFHDGSSVHDVVESLENRNDLKYVVWMQCWAGKYLECRDRIVIYEVIDFDLVKMRFKSEYELKREREEAEAARQPPKPRDYIAENEALVERSHKRGEGERMVDGYVCWPVIFRFILPLFGKLKPPSSNDPDIQRGIDDRKERLGLYGRRCEYTDKTRR